MKNFLKIVDHIKVLCYYINKYLKEVDYMVTEYGKILRKIRIDKGELLGDMADCLNISSSYLSSIETGVRNIPIDFTDKIIKVYNLSTNIQKRLRKAELLNIKEIKVPFNNVTSSMRKETAIIFARTFNNISDDDFEKIKSILVKRGDNN